MGYAPNPPSHAKFLRGTVLKYRTSSILRYRMCCQGCAVYLHRYGTKVSNRYSAKVPYLTFFEKRIMCCKSFCRERYRNYFSSYFLCVWYCGVHSIDKLPKSMVKLPNRRSQKFEKEELNKQEWTESLDVFVMKNEALKVVLEESLYMLQFMKIVQYVAEVLKLNMLHL